MESIHLDRTLSYSRMFIYTKPIPVQTRTYGLAYHTIPLLTFPHLAFSTVFVPRASRPSSALSLVWRVFEGFRHLILFVYFRPCGLRFVAGWSGGCQMGLDV